MGVLKVNVGDAVTPDWRNVGCGDPSWSYDPGILTNGDAEAGTTGFVHGAFWTLSTVSSPMHSGSLAFASTDSGATTVSNEFLSNQTLVVTAGLSYTAGAWARNDGFEADGQIVIEWRTAGGTFVSDDVGSITVVDGSGWVWVSVTAVAPSGAARAKLIYDMSLNARGTLPGPLTTYWDDLSFTDYTPAATGRLKLWTGTEWVKERCDDEVSLGNLLSADDAGFEGSSTFWNSPASDNSEVISTDAAHTGSQSLNVTSVAPSALWTGRVGIPGIEPSTSYTFSLWFRTRNASPTNDVYLILQTLDTSSLDTQQTVVGPVTVSTTWTHITGTATSPADTDTGRFVVQVGGTFGVGIDAFIDDAEVLGLIPTPGHPLYVNVGTPSVPDWQLVACMTPV